PMEKQYQIASVLDKVTNLISLRKQQLAKLDELVNARFVEMFRDPVCNSKNLPTERGASFFKLSNGKFVPESRRLKVGIPAYGGNGISRYTDGASIKKDTLVVGHAGFQSGNIHFAKGPLWITDNAMYISDYNTEQFNLFFLYSLMEHIDFTRFQDAGDLKKITQKPFMNVEYIMPPMQLQREYVAFAEQTDRSKLTIQQSLDKLEVLKKALMQEYFG
uniref:restriction endonuclease subunit S n=1 Tax=Oscillibacter sp. CU971 TaxID=2780102 RepID=UPI00195E18AA